MSKLYDQLAGEIFDTLKGNGKILSLFDKDGNRVFAPTKARRVFCQPDKMMISLDENGEDSQVKMYLSQSTSLKDMQKLINTIRNISTRYNVLFNVRKFGKELCPRDFAYQALPVQESLAESLWGTVKTSYDKIGTSKLVIRHTGPIDENKKGSRTRHIKSVFIETDRGERFRAPTNLRAARALARHTTMGGTPYDDLGNIITSLATESRSLSMAARHLRRSSLNESGNRILESVHVRMDEIREILQALSKPKKYESIKEALLGDDSLLNEDETELDEVSKSVFDALGDNDKIRESLPYLARAVMKESGKTDTVDLSEENVKRDVVKTLQGEFGFKEGLDFSFSRTDPLRMTMTRKVAEEVLPYLEEFHPGGYLNEGTVMNNRLSIKPGMQDKALNILNNIGGFREGKDFKFGGLSGKIIPTSPANFKEMSDLLAQHGVLVGSNDALPKPSAKGGSTRRGMVYSKARGVWEDEEKPKSKIEAWAEKWLDTNMPQGSSALNTPGDDAQIDSRAKDLAHGIADFMTGKMAVNVKPVDDSRFRSEQDAYNYKVGEVAETHFENDIFSNFLATIYDKLMHGAKLSGPEKQIADKAASYASVSESIEEDDTTGAFKVIKPFSVDVLEDGRVISWKAEVGDTITLNGNKYMISDGINSCALADTKHSTNEDKFAKIQGRGYIEPEAPVEEKDMGKKGKNFSKIVKSAGKEYGSKEAGEKVAGAVLAKLRHAHPEEYTEDEDQAADVDMNKEADDEAHLNISFPFDGDDKVAKVLTAYFDDLNVLSNNINDGRRNMVFNIPAGVNASGYTEKATSLLDGMDVQDSEVSMSGDSDTVGGEEEDQVNEFAGDEDDWSGKSPKEGDMVSTPMGPGHIVEINGDEVKVEMMNGKVNSFHKDDVGGVNESINKQIDEWFAQFDPKNMFSEDGDDDQSSVGVLTLLCVNKSVAEEMWQCMDGYHTYDTGIEQAENDETTDDTWKVTAKFYDADEMEEAAKSMSNIYGVIDVDTSFEPVTEDEDSMDAADSVADQDSMNSDDSDLDDDSADAADSADFSVDEAFSDDPVGDADRYYGAMQDRADAVDSALNKAADDFDFDEFVNAYGADFGMDNIAPGAEPEDITATDKEVEDSIAHYLAQKAMQYDDVDVSMDDAKDIAEELFKEVKPELEAKGLLFAKNEATLPGNVQTDFRRDASNGVDPELARMKELAGLNRR